MYKKFNILIFIFCISIYPQMAQNAFKTQQKKYKRVQIAYAEKYDFLKSKLDSVGIDINNLQIFIRAIKDDRTFEVWIKEKGDSQYVLFTDYDFCSFSGDIGPKRREGDGQIPEGVYYINHFNPFSSFFLSMGINYPNKSDKILGHKTHPGGLIYIHGDCVTIGCIPITDDKIKELYVLAVEAKNNGQQKIPVHIFPARLTEAKINEISYNGYAKHKQFWEQLLPIYSHFEKHKQIPRVNMNNDGRYILIQ